MINSCDYSFEETELRTGIFRVYLRVNGKAFESWNSAPMSDIRRLCIAYIDQERIPPPIGSHLSAVTLLAKSFGRYERTRQESIWFDTFVKVHPAEAAYKAIESEIRQYLEKEFHSDEFLNEYRLESWKEILYPLRGE